MTPFRVDFRKGKNYEAREGDTLRTIADTNGALAFDVETDSKPNRAG